MRLIASLAIAGALAAASIPAQAFTYEPDHPCYAVNEVQSASPECRATLRGTAAPDTLENIQIIQTAFDKGRLVDHDDDPYNGPDHFGVYWE